MSSVNNNNNNASYTPYSLLAKSLYLYGFGMWMTLITINNINDPGTNILFIKNMLEMNLFKPGSGIGDGLLWRSIHIDGLAQFLLWGTIIVEGIIDVLMWRAFISVVRSTIRKKQLDHQIIGQVNLALTSMLFLFVMFITGGMWFAYWVNQGPFQMVHLTGIIITLLGFIFFNQDYNRK